jgi:hypothetical protein
MKKVDPNNSPHLFFLKKIQILLKTFQRVPASSQNLKGLLKVNKKNLSIIFLKLVQTPQR